jgi:hypothetical protein
VDFSKASNLQNADSGAACADSAPAYPDSFSCDLRKCTAPLPKEAPKCGFANPIDVQRRLDLKRNVLGMISSSLGRPPEPRQWQGHG